MAFTDAGPGLSSRPSSARCARCARKSSWTSGSQHGNGDDSIAGDIESCVPASILFAPGLLPLHPSGIEIPCSLDKRPTATSGSGEDKKLPSIGTESTNLEVSGQMLANQADGGLLPKKPFSRWMRTLQKRTANRRKFASSAERISPYGLPTDTGQSALSPPYYRESSSESSLAFVTATRSMDSSLAGVSLLTRSRRNTQRSSRRTDHSSRASVSGTRLSEDSVGLDRAVAVDAVIMERALQRRRVLEELISTEESYISDVRFLMNVYVTILAALPTLPAGLRSSINRNLTDIVELHEEILGELHRAVPHSEYTQLDLPSPSSASRSRDCGHHRWRSLDSVPEDKVGMSWLRHIPGMTSEPQVAAEVAKVFSRKMNRFFIYEEYGARYELMIKDVAAAHRTMPRWNSYQKGLESLAAALSSASSQEDHTKRSLTMGDLLMKPIQRICKYPLLFAELLKYTPVVDCPYSHMEIENSLFRLREATSEINKATDDIRIKAILEKTWILQDRLAFPNQKLDAVSKNRIRSLGHVQLCGVLHVCWKTKQGVDGQYMIALLYKEWLCLATASKVDQVYTIQACIALSNIKVEDVDNGRGLQCHTAPYSWKLVFLCDHQLYEMIMTACTSKEESEWRTRLSSRPPVENEGQVQVPYFSSLSLNIETLGAVFGKPGSAARGVSIHRATTVGPRSSLCQVILKNTSVVRDASTPENIALINRSQSLLATNERIPVLAPARAERARLEAAISDVWTREALPFPGITVRSRSEHIVRASASSVIRKLSVASIAGSFTKRTASTTSLPKINVNEDQPSHKLESLGSANPSATFFERCNLSEDGGRSLLSVIPDESERRSTSMAVTTASEADSEWAADVFRTVRGLTAKEGVRDVTFVSGATTTTESTIRSMQSSSANGHHRRGDRRQLRHLREPEVSVKGTASICPSGKENNLGGGTGPSASNCSSPHESCQSRKLPSSRWVKMGAMHREVVVQGFRSLFR